MTNQKPIEAFCSTDKLLDALHTHSDLTSVVQHPSSPAKLRIRKTDDTWEIWIELEEDKPFYDFKLLFKGYKRGGFWGFLGQKGDDFICPVHERPLRFLTKDLNAYLHDYKEIGVSYPSARPSP